MRDYLLVKIIIAVLLIILIVIALLFLKQKRDQGANYSGSRGKIVLSEGFPEMPVYPDSVLVESSKSEEKGGPSCEGRWENEEDTTKVMNWYVEKLTGSGWEVDIPASEGTDKDVQFLSVVKDDIVLELSVLKDQAGKTNIVADFSLYIVEESENSY